MLVDNDVNSAMKVRGVTRKRREYEQRQTEEKQNEERMPKRREDILNKMLGDCSLWVKKKVLENKELDIYIKSNDRDEFASPPSLSLYENKNGNNDKATVNSYISKFLT